MLAPRMVEILHPASAALELSHDKALRSRGILVQRLCDLICWPSSRIMAYERELAGDVLVGLLRTAELSTRAVCASRLAAVADLPKALLRFLARDDLSVAGPLLEASPALDESDIVATINATRNPHWLVLARRRRLSQLVTEALVRRDDRDVSLALVFNETAQLSHAAVQLLVAQSRDAPRLSSALVMRPELTPAQALTVFWWADAASRQHILRRFAVDRAVLCAELSELFTLAAQEDWADPETRRALALIERRQRSRLAAERSPYKSLEGAIEFGARNGFARDVVDEIAYLSGIRPATGAKIFSDPGGEGLAVLCKATGLKRESLRSMWSGLERSLNGADDVTTPFGRVMLVFETLATAKAQTVLRYWNWALTSGGTPSLSALANPDDDTLEFAPAQRIAALVFGVRQ